MAENPLSKLPVVGQLLVSVHFDYSGTALGTDALRVLEGHGSSVHAVAFRPSAGQRQSRAAVPQTGLF